jgi:TRAP-type uncharacterized transport system substrate-binding protein
MAALSSRVILGVILIVIIVGIIGYYIATQRAAVTTPTPTPTPPKVEVKVIRIGTTEAGSVGYIIGSIIASELKSCSPE